MKSTFSSMATVTKHSKASRVAVRRRSAGASGEEDRPFSGLSMCRSAVWMNFTSKTPLNDGLPGVFGTGSFARNDLNGAHARLGRRWLRTGRWRSGRVPLNPHSQFVGRSVSSLDNGTTLHYRPMRPRHDVDHMVSRV